MKLVVVKLLVYLKREKGENRYVFEIKLVC